MSKGKRHKNAKNKTSKESFQEFYNARMNVIHDKLNKEFDHAVKNIPEIYHKYTIQDRASSLFAINAIALIVFAGILKWI